MTLTFQEILEGIIRHRADPVNAMNIERKITEIEWALQALAEKLRDESNE